MKHFKLLFLVSFIGCEIIFAVSFERLAAQQIIGGRTIKKGVWKGRQIEYVDRQIAIKIKNDVQVQDVNILVSQQSGRFVKRFDKLRWGLIELPEGSDIFPVIDLLRNSPLIETAEPNGVIHTSFDPNDTYYQDGHQWALKNTGQNPPSGTNDADIDANEAWDITDGKIQYYYWNSR